jgi:DNA repair protein RadD
MILKHLSEAELQSAVGTDVLERLEVLGPLLLGDDADPTNLYRKKNLVRVVSAFGAAARMKDNVFRRKLLNALPEAILDRLLEATGIAPSKRGFAAKCDALVRLGWHDVNVCRQFLAAAALPDTFLPPARNDVPDSEDIAPNGVAFKRLKDYQTSVHVAALDALTPPRARFVVQMPTGSGKTRTAMEVIADVLNGHSVASAPGPRTVVWLAHAEELCEQAIQCFREVWVHLGNSPCTILRVFGAHALPNEEHDGPSLIVGGFQKLHTLLSQSPHHIAALARRNDLLVIDEAHKVLAPTYEQVAGALIGSDTRVIGLTATPGRAAADNDQNTRLADFFFSQVVTLSVPDGESVLSFLRKRKVLARAKMERLAAPGTVALTTAQIRSIERELDYPPGLLATIGSDDLRNVEIITKLKALCAEGRRILLFACSVEHSKFICAVMLYLGVKAAHVDGTTQQGERSATIAAFKSGDTQVLCNYGILSTGFDAPKTDVVFITRPTKSIVLYSQMVGRGLRGPAIGGKPSCVIVNVIDNIVGLPDNESIYDYFQEYWHSDA